MDNVVTSHYVVIDNDGDWIINFLSNVDAFCYVTIFLNESLDDSIEFYHDNKGWLPTEIHDEFIFKAGISKIDSLGKYHTPEEVEDIVQYLYKVNNLRSWI